MSLQPSGTLEVVLLSCGRVVLTAVNLNGKFVLEGDEIDDVGADGGLLGSTELPGAKILPKALLGLGRRIPQSASTLDLFAVHGTMMVQVARPLPNPLPQQGEGIE